MDRTTGFETRTLRLLATVLPLLLLVASTTACGGASGLDRGGSAGYRTAFPSTDTSEQLSRLFQAVKQTQVTVTYDVHLFPEEDAPSRRDLARADVLGRAVSTTVRSESRAATAVVVSRSSRDVVLLASSHAVFRPDTIIEYFGPPLGAAVDPERKIRSISIKSSQTNWVMGLPGARTFDVLVQDEVEDLALIGFRRLSSENLDDVSSLPVRAGDPARLAPGSFVYVLGYPGSFRMVSRGIATPVGDDQDSFVIDGNWNQGVSGGVVVALRGRDERLEWVGMARAASAVREQRLMPSEIAVDRHDPAAPYEGPIFLDEVLRIQYGVMLSVPITTIRRFVARSEGELRLQGYQIPRF